MLNAPRTKLLFAIKTLDSMAGGAEKVFSQVASEMTKRGFSVSALTFDTDDAQPFYRLDPAVKKVFLGIGDPAQKSTPGETLRRIFALRRSIKAQNPDVVVAFMHSMFVPVSLALIGTGIPVIASEHTVSQHYEGRPFEFFMFQVASFFIKKITVVSEAARTDFPAHLRKRMVVIPNPLHVSKSANSLDRNHKIILSVGRLDPKKDQATLIQAFAKLAPEYPEWVLKIVGDGETREALEKLVTDLNLQDRVILTGVLRDIDSAYAEASFFVTASHYESLGLATLEALAHGLPAIGFQDCPGTNRIIQDNHNGYLVAAADRVTGLAKAMKRLIDDQDRMKEFSKNALESIKTYRAQDAYQSWQSLIRNI